jgi:hypothetical protein
LIALNDIGVAPDQLIIQPQLVRGAEITADAQPGAYA